MTPNIQNTPYRDISTRYSKPPVGFEDHWYIHYYEISVSAAQVVNQLPLLIDTDADFYWRATMGNQPGSFLMRFWDPFGNMLSDNLDVQENVVSNVQPAVHYPEIYCPRGSTVKVDITNLLVKSSNTMKLALIGVKRYQAQQ